MRHEAWRPAAGKVAWSGDLATTRSPSVFPTSMGMTQIDTREQRTPPKHFSNAPSQFSNPKSSLLNLPQGACDAKFVSPASANARRDRVYGRPIPKGAARPSGDPYRQRRDLLDPPHESSNWKRRAWALAYPRRSQKRDAPVLGPLVIRSMEIRFIRLYASVCRVETISS